MKPIKFRAAFGYDTAAASDESAVDFKGEVSLTVQSMAEDADINVLMDRYGITGKMPVNPRVPMYGDFEGITDFHSAQMALLGAYDAFMELPAKVRARFRNNPQELLDFMADDANLKEAQFLGLIPEKPHGEDNDSGRGAGGSDPGAAGAGGPPPEAGGAAGDGAAGREGVPGGRQAPPGGGKGT